MHNAHFTRRARLILISFSLVILLSFDWIAWMQAHAMTHYAGAGSATPKPEALSLPEKVWTVFSGVTVPRPRNVHTPADAGLSYETRKIDVASGGYLEGWYVPQQQAHTIVLMFPATRRAKRAYYRRQ